jgi:hypothetical protein
VKGASEVGWTCLYEVQLIVKGILYSGCSAMNSL